jgi:hypothetical protein
VAWKDPRAAGLFLRKALCHPPEESIAKGSCRAPPPHLEPLGTSERRDIFRCSASARADLDRSFVWQAEEFFQAQYRGGLPLTGSAIGVVGQSEELFQPLYFGDDLFGVHGVVSLLLRTMLEAANAEV